MNYYQITFNNLEGFNPNLVHQLITANLGVTDWWHYIPSTYLIETTSTSYYLANRIISAFSGMNFLITKIDINDYNGYLDKRAWEWLERKLKKNQNKTTYVPYARSPLAELLKGINKDTSTLFPQKTMADSALRSLLKIKK